MTEFKAWFVIINPTSGNGSCRKKWPCIKKFLEQHNFDFDFAFTQYENHSVELVHKAINKGVLNLISIGGDGTLHNIVNGIMTQNKVSSSLINVGVIPIGTGNDWVKTHSIPKRVNQAIQLIKKGKTKLQDVGKIEFLNDDKPAIYFNNLAGVGFDGYVVSKVEKYKRFGALAYLTGTLLGLSSFKNFKSKVVINSKIEASKSLMVLVGLCNYSGGGMQLTESPNAFDGLFDISIAKDFKTFDILKNVAKLFNGKIVNFKKVNTFKSQVVTIEIKQDHLPFIQADGELIGKGGFTASVIPKAFSFYL
ncbi:diacylglycerol/lipid kinase family protein [Ichthyenterobacterium magnum]|uniref:YegS/Rv2252/BmrU family lipid kinase n=1 Tax=Ichthyenterobacterium magnum TaxID=1230530 RepID=A0A420DX74_9FLAO|nr:diacylglycerol kinase family protein [Ichthyenterobacterium magnum]RKE98813.1 YegS/Rv2252/BmrU family lipid kinase [Ichthyenterobacterium magnum]